MSACRGGGNGSETRSQTGRAGTRALTQILYFSLSSLARVAEAMGVEHNLALNNLLSSVQAREGVCGRVVKSPSGMCSGS